MKIHLCWTSLYTLQVLDSTLFYLYISSAICAPGMALNCEKNHNFFVAVNQFATEALYVSQVVLAAGLAPDEGICAVCYSYTSLIFLQLLISFKVASSTPGVG